LNPIEQVFAKLKHLLRKAAARTVDTLSTATGEALDAFPKNAPTLKNSGYQPNAIAL
jgi:transposase